MVDQVGAWMLKKIQEGSRRFEMFHEGSKISKGSRSSKKGQKRDNIDQEDSKWFNKGMSVLK